MTLSSPASIPTLKYSSIERSAIVLVLIVLGALTSDLGEARNLRSYARRAVLLKLLRDAVLKGAPARRRSHPSFQPQGATDPDPLTGLMNRRAFLATAKDRCDIASGRMEGVALMMGLPENWRSNSVSN